MPTNISMEDALRLNFSCFELFIGACFAGLQRKKLPMLLGSFFGDPTFFISCCA
jgi:hypothetical protein